MPISKRERERERQMVEQVEARAREKRMGYIVGILGLTTKLSFTCMSIEVSKVNCFEC